jgi:hypothetical protein
MKNYFNGFHQYIRNIWKNYFDGVQRSLPHGTGFLRPIQETQKNDFNGFHPCTEPKIIIAMGYDRCPGIPGKKYMDRFHRSPPPQKKKKTWKIISTGITHPLRIPEKITIT